jgi:hypothetical protein
MKVLSGSKACRLRMAEAYSEGFQVIHRDFIAEQMQQSILKHTSMTVSIRSGMLSAQLTGRMAA